VGKFVKSITIQREFQEDSVTITARPMDRATALRMRGLRTVEKAIAAGGAEVSEDGADAESAAMFLLDAFSQHITDISGPRDSDGNAIDKTTILSTAYFMPLLTDAAPEWLKRSSPGN
jgi:hypothetical protein